IISSPTYLWISPPASAMASDRSVMNRLRKSKKRSSPNALSDRCGGAHVDEQQNALLTPRVVIAPGDEGEQHARAKQIVDAQQQIVADAQSEREGDVGAGDADSQIAGDEHKEDDAQVEQRA